MKKTKKDELDKEEGFGTRLEEFRSKYLKLSQREFAQSLKTTQGNISQIEKTVRLPSGAFVIRLSERFPEIDLNWLFSNEGEPIRKNSAQREFENKISLMSAELERLKREASMATEFIREEPRATGPLKRTIKSTTKKSTRRKSR